MRTVLYHGCRGERKRSICSLSKGWKRKLHHWCRRAHVNTYTHSLKHTPCTLVQLCISTPTHIYIIKTLLLTLPYISKCKHLCIYTCILKQIYIPKRTRIQTHLQTLAYNYKLVHTLKRIYTGMHSPTNIVTNIYTHNIIYLYVKVHIYKHTQEHLLHSIICYSLQFLNLFFYFVRRHPSPSLMN